VLYLQDLRSRIFDNIEMRKLPVLLIVMSTVQLQAYAPSPPPPVGTFGPRNIICE
jgi:hypothetical protein